MKPKSAAILKHILDSLYVTVLAAIIVFLAWKTTQTYCDKFINWVRQINFLTLTFVFIAILLWAGWFFPREIVASVRSLKLWPRHWGLAVRGFIGSVFVIVFALCFKSLKAEPEWIVIFILETVLVEALILLIGFSVAKFHLYLQENSKQRFSNQRTDDEPILTLEENLFPEYETTTRRVLDRLKLGSGEERGPNVALIGPYGSGKTSICNLINNICQKEKVKRDRCELLFCRFEAWQFLTVDAAVRELLDKIVRKVQEQVDCSELGKIPEEYLEALRACPNWWLKVVATILGKRRNIEEIMQILQDVLLRINKRVVVFVDDFDRIEHSSKEAQEAIAAALNQLQNLTNVQYVLCVGPMRDGPGADLLKLTRFQELMPEIHGEEVIESIRVLRDEAVAVTENMYYPWNLMQEGGSDPLYYSPMTEYLSANLASQLVKMIKIPRELKSLVQETREKWNGGLKGEISWYDLLLMSMLKISEPRIFEWILRESQLFLDEEIHIGEPTNEERNEARRTLEKHLEELVKVSTKLRIELVKQILFELFPNFTNRFGDNVERMGSRRLLDFEQNIALKPFYGTSYFRRYNSGHIPDKEVPDQPILQYIRNLSKEGFDCRAFEQRYLDSFSKLTNDLNRFVQFSGLLSKELARNVCDCMLDWMCDREHWNVWEKKDDYISALMPDVKRIIDNAGQFERTWRNNLPKTNHATTLEEWNKECLRKLASRDIIVAIAYGYYVSKEILGEQESMTLLGSVIKEQFLNNTEDVLEKVKGARYHLNSILRVLRANKDYESIREHVTKTIIKEAETDKSGEFIESVVITLVNYQYPAGKPDLIEGYELSINKEENQKTYDMKILLPIVVKWKGHKFKDPVAAKAHEFLLKEYAEELNRIVGEAPSGSGQM